MESADANRDRALWLAYQAVALRRQTRPRDALEGSEQATREDLLYPLEVDASQGAQLTKQLQGVADQAGLALPDLLRWAILHLQPSSDPLAQALDGLRLEQLQDAVKWQQHRFDAQVHDPEPSVADAPVDGATLRRLLQTEGRR